MTGVEASSVWQTPIKRGIDPKLVVDLAVFLLGLRIILGATGVWFGYSVSAPLTALNFVVFTLAFLASPRLKYRYHSLAILFTCFVFAAVLSLLLATPPQLGLALDAIFRVAYLLIWVMFSAMYFASSYALMRLRQLVRILILAGFAFGVAQVLLAPDRFSIAGEVRAFGVSSHPVLFGMLMLTAIVAQEILRIKLNEQRTYKCSVFFVLGITGMALAVAQTAWLMGAIMMAVVVSSRVGKPLRLIALLLSGAAVLTVLYSMPWTRDVFSLFEVMRHLSEISSDSYSYHFVDNSMAWRVVNWKMSLTSALPVWYSGFGPGHAEYYNYFGLTLHNMFFEVFVEFGVLGLMALIMITLEIKRCLKQPSAMYSATDEQAKKLFSAYSIGLLVASLFSVTLLGQTLLLTLYFALLVAVTTPSSELE